MAAWAVWEIVPHLQELQSHVKLSMKMDQNRRERPIWDRANGNGNLARVLNPSSVGSVDILDRIILCGGDCPVHYWYLAASLGSTYRVPAAPVTLSHPSCDNKKCLQILSNVPGGRGSCKFATFWEPALWKHGVWIDNSIRTHNIFFLLQ